MRVSVPGARLSAPLERSAPAFAAAAFALGVLPWWPTVFFAFAYDDRWTVVRNEALRRPLGALFRASLSGLGTREIPDVSRPVMVASNWVDLRLWGTWAAGHHLSSVLVHGLLVVAAAFLARSFLRALPALGAAGLFSLAPGHAEAVSAINYREDLLSGLGVYAALAVVAWPARGARRLGVELGAACAFLFALLAKESAVGLVPLVALLALAQAAPGRWLARRERVLTLLGAVLLAWGHWRWGLALAGDGVARAAPATAWEHLLRLGRYLGWSLAAGAGVPVTSPVHGPAPSPATWHALLPLALLLTVASRWTWRRWPAWRHHRREVAAAGLWLGGALGSCPLLGAANEEADRYLVLGSLGLSLLAVQGLSALGRSHHRVAAAAGAALALAWGGLSARDGWAWRDERALWTAATQRSPDSPRAWVGLSWVHRGEGDTARARAALDAALARDADYAPAWVSAAYVSLLDGDPDAARRALARAERLHPQPRSLPGLQRAKACLELEPVARRACARGESVAAHPGVPP